MQTTETPCCPRCGSAFVKPVRPEGPLEYLLHLCHIHPLQCQLCWRRVLRYNRGGLPPRAEHDVRRFERVACPMLVTVMTETIRYESSLLDLSIGGCRLHTATVLTVGSTLRLELRLEADASPIVIERAVVRWAQPAAAGVEFVAFQEQARAALSRYLRQFLATEAQPQAQSKHCKEPSRHF